MSDSLQEFTDENFGKQVLENSLPVAVDFWAPWCGPCKLVGPIIEELAAEYQGRLVFGKMDIAQHPQTAATYGIRSIPALLFFRQGQVADSLMGAHGKDRIKKSIKKIME